VFKISKILVVIVAMGLSLHAMAEGKIAVVNLQEAIMQTDEAQGRLNGLLAQADFATDKAEFDRLKIATKQADIEHVGRKLNTAQQELGQTLLQEMSPKVNAVLRDLIKSEGIGLLLQHNVVIHSDTSFNVTAKVTDKLNQNAAQ